MTISLVIVALALLARFIVVTEKPIACVWSRLRRGADRALHSPCAPPGAERKERPTMKPIARCRSLFARRPA
jgi:hypothetical protein